MNKNKNIQLLIITIGDWVRPPIPNPHDKFIQNNKFIAIDEF